MAVSIFTTDHGHTVERALKGIAASERIVCDLEMTPKEKAFWQQLLTYWRTQLRFAERKKGRKK